MFKCAICGKEYNNVDEYSACVAKCAYEQKRKEEEARRAKLNSERKIRQDEIKDVANKYNDLIKAYQKDYGYTDHGLDNLFGLLDYLF